MKWCIRNGAVESVAHKVTYVGSKMKLWNHLQHLHLERVLGSFLNGFIGPPIRMPMVAATESWKPGFQITDGSGSIMTSRAIPRLFNVFAGR